MAWYDDGTIAVTGGSAAVVGTGTAFVENVKIGDALRGPDERLYQIASVNSATSLTLTRNYGGATAAGQAYEIVPLQDAMAVLARNVAALIEDYQDIADNAGQGMFGDGSLAAPGMRFAADQDTGLYRPSANVISIAAGGGEVFRGDVSGNAMFNWPTPVGKVTIRGKGTEATTLATSATNSALFLMGFAGSSWGLALGSSSGSVHYVQGVSAAGDAARDFTLNPYGGNIGIGTTTPGSKLHVAGGGIQITEGAKSITYRADYAGLGPTLLVTTNDPLLFATNNTERARIDSIGNLLVGIASSSSYGNANRICKDGASEGVYILSIDSDQGSFSAAFLSTTGTGWNPANAAMHVGTNSVTNRSINAAGTVNASGADYAEYMVKATGCGMIAKGDVCGVDIDGKLTQSWAAARSFVIKSTNPSLVGGDTWAIDLDLRPEPPAPLGPAPVAPTAPEPFTDPEPTQGEEESEAAFAVRLYIWGQASDAADAAQEAYDDAVAAFPNQLAAWESASATYAADLAQYEADLAAWEAALEAGRVKVDRIAFCGQVPANLTGAVEVGDYVLPAEGDGDTITAVAVAESAITFEQYRRRIGKVWAIREGRAWIDVQHG